MKKAIFIICMALFACGEEKMPENVYPEDEMVKILIEVHLLEAKIQKLYIARDSSQILYQHYEKKLFEELDVDREKYNNSMIYYVDNGYKMSDIYDRVVDSLLLQQQTLSD